MLTIQKILTDVKLIFNLEICANGHVIAVICIHLPLKIRGLSTKVKFRVAQTPLYGLLCK